MCTYRSIAGSVSYGNYRRLYVHTMRGCTHAQTNARTRAHTQVGIKVNNLKLPREITESELLATIHQLNSNPTIHGILLQLPLDSTSPIDADKCTNAIAIEKVR